GKGVVALKRLWVSLLAMLLLFACMPVAAVWAADGEKIRWSEVKTGTYEPLRSSTLNWSGDVLGQGGLSLTSMKIVSGKEADIVINQYGAMGANGILKVNESLTA